MSLLYFIAFLVRIVVIMYRVCLSPWTSVQIPSPGGLFLHFWVERNRLREKGIPILRFPIPIIRWCGKSSPKVLRDRGGSSSLIQKCLPPFSIPERVIAGLGSPFYPFVVKEGHAPPSPDMKRGKSRTKLVSNSERVVNTHPHWVSQLPKTGRPTDERDFDFDTI